MMGSRLLFQWAGSIESLASARRTSGMSSVWKRAGLCLCLALCDGASHSVFLFPPLLDVESLQVQWEYIDLP